MLPGCFSTDIGKTVHIAWIYRLLATKRLSRAKLYHRMYAAFTVGRRLRVRDTYVSHARAIRQCVPVQCVWRRNVSPAPISRWETSSEVGRVTGTNEVHTTPQLRRPRRPCSRRRCFQGPLPHNRSDLEFCSVFSPQLANQALQLVDLCPADWTAGASVP